MSDIAEILSFLKDWKDSGDNRPKEHMKCDDLEFEQRLSFFRGKHMKTFWGIWLIAFIFIIGIGLAGVNQFYEIKGVLKDYTDNIRPTIMELKKSQSILDKRILTIEQNPIIKYPLKNYPRTDVYKNAP